MRIHLYATLRATAGEKVVDVPTTGRATVQALLDGLLTHYPALRSQVCDPNGVLFDYVHLFINGRDVRYLAHGLGEELKPQDRVSLFPAVGGG